MSSLRVNAITDTSGGSTNLTVSGKNTAKAWVSFNGTGTVAIRSQFNVSSITDNGTGDYTVNFTSAMADANYCWVANCKDSDDVLGNVVVGQRVSNAYTTTQLRLDVSYSTGFYDSPAVNVTIFGN